jgi:hypothetical protein
VKYLPSFNKLITNKMKKTLFLTIYLFLAVTAFTQVKKKQTLLTGYQYHFDQDKYYPFKYSRSFSNVNDSFITTYKIYDPSNGKYVYTIVATHDKENRKVTVEVRDATEDMFNHICTEEITYDSLSMQPFGYRGDIGALAGSSKNVPNQLGLKFVSNKFENVEVISVNGTDIKSSDFIYYVLDEN